MTTQPTEQSPQSFSPVVTEGPSKTSLLWLVGGSIVIGVLLSFAVSLWKVAQTVDTRAIFLGLDGLRIWIGLGLVALALFIGWVALVRPRFKFVFGCLLIVSGLGYTATQLVRVDSFYGNMVPRLAWSWTPEFEDEFAEYDLSASTQTQPVAVSSAVDQIQASGSDFTGYLGKHRDGVISDVHVHADWQAHPPELLWRKSVGAGWSSFAVVGSLAVTQEQRGELETVVAYDVESGEELWVHGDPVRFEDEHGDGPRAVPTFHQGRFYTIGATGILNCLDAATGNLVWQQPTLDDPDKNNLLWGMCGCPLIVDQQVIVTPGGGEGQAIKAFDLESGSLVFANGDDPTAYASPNFTKVAGRDQFLCFNGAGLRGFSPTGEPLWLFPWITQGEHQRVNVAQPIVVQHGGGEEQAWSDVLISSGYGMGIVRLRVTRAGDEYQVEPVWESKALKAKMSNFVVHDGHIYGFDNGIFACLSLEDGRRVWKRGRYGHGQVLLVGEHLLVQAESGDVLLLAASPKGHDVLAELPALVDKTWNHASLAGNLLLVRNDREAACFRLKLVD